MVGCILYNQWSSSILFTCLAVLGSIELTGLLEKKLGLSQYKNHLVFFFILAGVGCWLGFFYYQQLMVTCVVFLAVLLLFGPVLFLLPNPIQNRLSLSLTLYFITIYVFAPFILLALFSISQGELYVPFYTLYFFILIWTNDTMAYVCGRLLGKHKLAESISPKKTVEGFVGGLIFTSVMSWISIRYIFDLHVEYDLIWWLIPVCIGVFATLGDLFESAIKRWVGVKDSGTLIPGHGGILDRFDGAIGAIWSYILLLFLANC